VQAEASGRDRAEKLAAVYVRAGSGALVPLSSLVRIRDVASARELGRFNKIRAITIQAGIGSGYSLGRALDFLEREAKKSP
jgi:multidrug efflux pump